MLAQIKASQKEMNEYQNGLQPGEGGQTRANAS
jgi:hypothetical protein